LPKITKYNDMVIIAGKSTTIGIITSLINKTSGTVKVFDHDIDNAFSQAKATIGLVPQEFNFNIFKPIMEVLTDQAGFYGIDYGTAVKRAEYYLKQLKLWDKRNSTPWHLSGGLKRRLMIARALVHQPKLLILDEPTAGVDIEIRRSMWHYLREINQQGTTVILTTHYLEEAEDLCHNVAIIDQGNIVEYGQMKEVLKKLAVETFVLNVASPINFAPELPQFHCRWIDESTLEVDVHQGQSINDLFALLSKQDIQVSSMRNKANRLEELFLGLINHHDQ